MKHHTLRNQTKTSLVQKERRKGTEQGNINIKQMQNL